MPPTKTLVTSNMRSTTPIRILALTANPTNTARLQLDREIREIEDGLQRSTLRDRFELINKGAVRIDELVDALTRYRPPIVHFSGHGAGENGLVLEDRDGKAQFVPNDALRKLFGLYRDTTRCIFLNACYSKIQAEALSEHIDCIVGMNRPIGDATAIQFAPRFYAALAEGHSFQDAFKLAKIFLELGSNRESSTPILEICQGAANLFLIETSTKPEPEVDVISLLETLNKLIPQDLNKLVLMLNVQNAYHPSKFNTPGERSEALINWAMSPTGCGLEKVQQDLDKLLGR